MNDHDMQHTLRQPIDFIGIGLHSGRQVGMTVRPAAPDSGVVFVRRDVPVERGSIPAAWYNVSGTELSTTLTNAAGVSVATVEHLLAALRGCGVDNARVEIDGGEVPIMDGSAGPFAELIEHIGLRAQDAPRQVIWVHRTVHAQDGDKLALLMPGPRSRITVNIDFPNRAIGAQAFSLGLCDFGFGRDVATARTFGFQAEIETLRARGLARGGSLRNAVLLDEAGVVNDEGLRFADEFVRHKALDCLGDLSLAGAPIMGHFYSYKPGHALNRALLKALFTQRDAWSRLPLAEFRAIWQIPDEADDTPDARDGLFDAM